MFPRWRLGLPVAVVGGANCIEGALWCAFGGKWVVVALRVAVLGGVVCAEGALRCPLGVGWVVLGQLSMC